MNRCRGIVGLLVAALPVVAAGASITGTVTDPQNQPVRGAALSIDGKPWKSLTDTSGRYGFQDVPPGIYTIRAAAPGFVEVTHPIRVEVSEFIADFQFQVVTQSVTVTASVDRFDVQHPDPAQRVLVREEVLDANPGRPGAPISIPGLPAETASGGIKAPQYFTPGVAGDHGEPIAQFIQVGSFLVPNNLNANAHGNGYADPNVLVPAVIESVQTDGGAFNVREGDHAVDLAATYGMRPRLQPFATLTADYRDVDLSVGWNWLAIQASYGNGFLDTLEHRQQYKVNVLKNWTRGAHELTMLFIGYSGESKIPGLVPLGVPNLHDTIDPRQREQTHTGEIAVNEVWHTGPDAELQLSSFFRTYNLSLYSNFGAGLIRQSEFRTVAGGNANYIRKLSDHISFMAGLDYFRDAPRRDDLDRYDPFRAVTANDITLNFVTPFIALDGRVFRWLRYNLGWRHDQVGFANTDRLVPANSFNQWVGINSPKATLALAPPDHSVLPLAAVSFGETFFTNDPRIGTGTQHGSLVSRAHAYQLVVGKTIGQTEFRVTLAHVTQQASLAKIDPDTGLQYNEGPGRNRYFTASVRRYFRNGMLQGLVSKADARDLLDGRPVPEAPRLIVDALATYDRLPFRLQARAEFEEVGRKPLGDGFSSVPVREFRGALVRSFLSGRLDAGVHFQIASGYTGQTTEMLALPGDADAFERVVGVYLPSYATLTFSYRFGR